MRAVPNRSAFPKIGVLPSVGHDYDTNGPCRRHPFIFSDCPAGCTNISVVGAGTIDGAGRPWWNTTTRRTLDPGVGRYGTFRLNFHRFDRFELDLRGHTQP